MSSFRSKLVISPVTGGKRWLLIEPFEYERGKMESFDIIRVPKDFETDFASIPRIFWSILPPWGRYGKAAVLHDWMYFNGKKTRKECDSIFLEAMGVLKVSWWKKKVMYLGVRSFGSIVWKAHRKKNV